jgi:hypothetical protein
MSTKKFSLCEIAATIAHIESLFWLFPATVVIGSLCTTPSDTHMIGGCAQQTGIGFASSAQWPGGASEDVDDPTQN